MDNSNLVPQMVPAVQSTATASTPNAFVPKRMFFTKGVGYHKEYLQSFEMALRDAGIAEYNLVTVSSIFPPNCKRISKDEGKKMLNPGQVVFCVMARNATSEPNRLIAASIGLAQPADANNYGLPIRASSFWRD
jgi:arginine decarboxylase